ncbi:hypothetical protein HanRHA438_Chr10g0459981 [Helianthus annuus]|nr:hypothetical protein HanRHA438_Chr10g0459981 [Helianthus annuus]
MPVHSWFRGLFVSLINMWDPLVCWLSFSPPEFIGRGCISHLNIPLNRCLVQLFCDSCLDWHKQWLLLVNLTDDVDELKDVFAVYSFFFSSKFLRYTHSLVLWLFLPQMVQLTAGIMTLVLFRSCAFR